MTSAVAPRPQRAPLVAPGQGKLHAADMAVTVAADLTLGSVQERLAQAGQWLALDGDPSRPMGALLVEDSTGPLRLGFGGWRDLLTGVQFTNGRGDLVTVGGVTVKNVAGYDLVKFLIGSHGCFGQPVTMTLRTYRRPEAALAGVIQTSAEGRGSPWAGIDGASVSNLMASAAPPQWMLLTPGGLRAGWLGRGREMAALEPVIGTIASGIEQRDLDADAAERWRLLDMGPERLRICLAPAALPALLSELNPPRFAADPAFGVLWLPVGENVDSHIQAALRRGGHAAWFGRDGVRVYGVDQAAAGVLQRLKAEFDPQAKLRGLPIQS